MLVNHADSPTRKVDIIVTKKLSEICRVVILTDLIQIRMWSMDFAWFFGRLGRVFIVVFIQLVSVVSMLEGANVRVKLLKDIKGKRAEIPNQVQIGILQLSLQVFSKALVRGDLSR